MLRSNFIPKRLSWNEPCNKRTHRSFYLALQYCGKFWHTLGNFSVFVLLALTPPDFCFTQLDNECRFLIAENGEENIVAIPLFKLLETAIAPQCAASGKYVDLLDEVLYVTRHLRDESVASSPSLFRFIQRYIVFRTYFIPIQLYFQFYRELEELFNIRKGF